MRESRIHVRRLTTSAQATPASNAAPENWEVLVGEMMKALMPFPEARQAVVTALAQADDTQTCPTCGHK